MVNYLNVDKVMKTREPYQSIRVNESSVDIERFLRFQDPKPSIDVNPHIGWDPTRIEIESDIIEWLEDNLVNHWTLAISVTEIQFTCDEDSWRFLEWLEEYEDGN